MVMTAIGEGVFRLVNVPAANHLAVRLPAEVRPAASTVTSAGRVP